MQTICCHSNNNPRVENGQVTHTNAVVVLRWLVPFFLPSINVPSDGMCLIIHGLLELAFPNWLAGLVLSAGTKKQKRQEAFFFFFSPIRHRKKKKLSHRSVVSSLKAFSLKSEKHLEARQLMRAGGVKQRQRSDRTTFSHVLSVKCGALRSLFKLSRQI